MDKGRVNEHILSALRQETKDEEIRNFLIDLISEESSNQGRWNYKNKYKELIEKHCLLWSKKNDH